VLLEQGLVARGLCVPVSEAELLFLRWRRLCCFWRLHTTLQSSLFCDREDCSLDAPPARVLCTIAARQGGSASAVRRPAVRPAVTRGVCTGAGSLTRDFKHLAVDMYLIEEEGAKKLKVDAHFSKRKQLAAIRTTCSHVQVPRRSCSVWPGLRSPSRE